MLPNLKNTCLRFSQPIVLRQATLSVIDFEEVRTYTTVSTRASVQPADPEKLRIENYDSNKEYMRFNCVIPIKIKDEIEWSGKIYRVIPSNKNYGSYGHYEAIAEEVGLAGD